MITTQVLEDLYIRKQLSVKEVATELNCSPNRVTYWMEKQGIKRRTLSDAIYIKHNPNGDPFTVKKIETVKDAELFGLGIGLYWGEGTKASKYAVRLGNSDPSLLRTFIRFLIDLYKIDKLDMRFGLQIFSDIDPQIALAYWCKELDVEPDKFYKLHITPSGSIGTYRKKSLYGVVTLYYHNKKLRDILVAELSKR